MSVFVHHPLFTIFTIIAIGALLGTFRLRGISLGAAGVFFVALVAGHLLGPLGFSVPKELTELGLVFFVYSVGLSAGPRFFSTMRRSGGAFALVGLGATGVGAALAVLLATLLGLSGELAAGMYCGATTCTPALAAVLDAISRTTGLSDGLTSGPSAALVAYGATYPFSVAGVVLAVQLLPVVLRTLPPIAAERFRQEEAANTPPIEFCSFRIINPNLAGRTINEIQALHVSNAVICRIRKGGHVLASTPSTIVSLGDIVMGVGTPGELAKLEALLGEVVVDAMQDPSGRLGSEQLLVSRRESIGKTLRELAIWETYGVVVTRIRRERQELIPRGDLRLEPGDVLRVVGPWDGINRLSDAVGREESRLNETSLVPFAAGIALGALLGMIPISLPGGLEMRLGPGGGAFLVGLLLGHAGTIGPVRLYVPNAAKHFAREVGLVLFLAGAGASAGKTFVQTIEQTGMSLILGGAAVTVVTVVVACLLMYGVLRWNLLFGAGSLCACMTNPPGLAAANNLADSNAAQVGFASVYPIALIGKILFAPLIFLIMRLLSE